jgi:hypothetical protein
LPCGSWRTRAFSENTLAIHGLFRFSFFSIMQRLYLFALIPRHFLCLAKGSYRHRFDSPPIRCCPWLDLLKSHDTWSYFVHFEEIIVLNDIFHVSIRSFFRVLDSPDPLHPLLSRARNPNSPRLFLHPSHVTLPFLSTGFDIVFQLELHPIPWVHHRTAIDHLNCRKTCFGRYSPAADLRPPSDL